jgi:hypothetical protein
LSRTGGVAWLIKHGFGLEPEFIRFDYNHNRLQSLGTVSSTACTCNSQAVPWIPLRPIGPTLSSWSNPTVGLARLLNSNSNCHWNLLEPHVTVELLLVVFWASGSELELPWSALLELSSWSILWTPGPGLNCPRMDSKVLTDRPCWNVIVDSLPQERQSATGLVSAVAVIWPGYVPMSGYCETRHSIKMNFPCSVSKWYGNVQWSVKDIFISHGGIYIPQT